METFIQNVLEYIERLHYKPGWPHGNQTRTPLWETLLLAVTWPCSTQWSYSGPGLRKTSNSTKSQRVKLVNIVIHYTHDYAGKENHYKKEM